MALSSSACTGSPLRCLSEASIPPIALSAGTPMISFTRELLPAFLDEIRLLTPKLPSGNRPHKFFQWFTPDFGHPKLKEHLAGVMALMRASPNWAAFQRSLKRAYPKLNETTPLPRDD